MGGTLYQIRLEGWYDDCLESRGYDKIDPDKYQDVIQSDFKQIVSDESGWGNSKENIYGYVPNVPGTTYGVTYIGRPIKTKQNSEYLEDVTNFIKLNYKCPKGTIDDSNKCTEGQNKSLEKGIIQIYKDADGERMMRLHNKFIKHNNAFMEDVVDFIKQNYKCPKGTVDDSNKCNTENDVTSSSKQETFIGFKADYDFSSKKSDILKTPRTKLVSLIDPELDNKLNNLSEQTKTLSKSEKHIISEYSLNEYININEFLTKKLEKNIPNPEELDILYRDAVLEQTKENVEKLDNIFKNVSLPENIISYRGLRNDILVGNQELMDALDAPGSEVSFDCFSSSSIVPFVASNFATGYNGRLLELQLPKGSKALYIANVSMSPSEYELLINRGTKFKVLESKTIEIMNPYKENNDKTKFKVTTLQAIL